MSRTAANTLALFLFVAGGAFFGRGLTDQDWKKILRRKKRVWMATQELVKFFPVEDWFFGQTMPFMSKLKLSMETWVCQEHFNFGKGKPPEAFKGDRIFQSGFFIIIINFNSQY